MSAERRRILLTAGVVGAVLIACVLLIRLREVQELVRDGIVLPIYYTVWVVWLFIIGIDQWVLWSLGLIALVLFIMYGLAAAWSRAPAVQKSDLLGGLRRAEDAPPRTYGRVRFWNNRIETLQSQGMDNDYAIHEFRRLAEGVADLGGAASGGQTDGLDRALKTFLAPPRVSFSPPAPAERWPQRLFGSLRRAAPGGPAPVQAPLAELCNDLEERLDIEYDDAN